MKAEPKTESDITAELKALGLKPVLRWLPDTSDSAFMERYQEQRAAVAAASQKSEIEWWEQSRLMKAGCEAGRTRYVTARL